MSDNVGELLTQRGNQWGDAIGTHVRIAQVWTGILDHKVEPVQVALMMEGLKLVRASINPDDPDSFHDAQGYDRIAELIAGHRTSLDDKSEFVQQAHTAVKEIIDSDPRCACRHPKTSHRDTTGNLGHCQSYYYVGPGDKRYCQCQAFRAMP